MPPRYKVREIVKLIENDGWQHVATRGSHRQYKHGSKPGRVTIPGKMSDDVSPAMAASILRQAGITKD